MASAKYDDLATINDRRRDWKIRVKVIRLWRRSTKDGQPFNNFNIMLLHKQVNFNSNYKFICFSHVLNNISAKLTFIKK